MNKGQTKAYLMIICSMLIWGTLGIFRKYIPLSSSMLALLRGVIGSLFLIIISITRNNRINEGIEKKNLLFLILSGTLIGLNWVLLFEAYNYTSVSVATLCYYMAPTIVILLSPIILKEKLTIKRLFLAIIAVIGMVLVSGVLNSSSNTSELKGIILGLLAAVLYASVVMLNKKISVTDSYKKTIIQLISASIILVPYVLLTNSLTGYELKTMNIIMILIVGIIHTGLAYALYFNSMSHLPSQSIAVLSYIDPVSALILSAIFLDERMTLLGLLGAILIIGASLLSEIKINRKED